MIIPKAKRLEKVEEYYFSKKLEQIQVMRSQGLNVINLGIGSPDLAPPSEVLDKAVEVIKHPSSHGYSSYRSLPELRKAIGQWLLDTYEVKADPNHEILPLLGSKEGILYLSLAVLNPGDKVLIPNPGYPAYSSVANLVGAEVIFYNLKEENHWLPDLEELRSLDLTGCRLMFVNYPHMPTGQAANLDFFKKLIAFGEEKKILICNDNPYGLVLNEEKPLSIFRADPEMKVSCELNSLSKSFNMAGWRVGLFLGARDLVDSVIAVKSNVDSGMFSVVQRAAIEALGISESWHQERNEVYRKRRAIIWEIFDVLGFTYRKDQVGLFVWAKAPDNIPEVVDYLDEILLKAHVFLTPGMIFGSNGKRFARASLCASEEILIEALKRIKDFCR